jgi:hypothetical protein
MEVTMDLLALFKLAVDFERLTRIIRQALYRH